MRILPLLALGAALLAHAAPEPYYIGTLAGSNTGLVTSRDGPAASAVFRQPRQAVADAQGNVYVADSGNHTVRKISGGVVSTLAGQSGVKGFADGPAASALFNEPSGVLVAADGSVLVLDTNNGRIRRIGRDGQVSTLAGGGGGSTRYADGVGSAAGFNEPRGFAQDAAGNLYVADYNNQVLRKVTPVGVVSTLAGAAQQQGSVDGTGSAARFSDPQAVALDAAGNIYVADTGITKAIRKVTPSGVVSTVLSQRNTARLAEPRGLLALADGTLLVATRQGHEVLRVSAGGAVSSFAGLERTPGSADGVGSAAGFDAPMGLSPSADGSVLLADSANHLIRQLSLGAVVSTLAGTRGYSASVEGERNSVRFEDPYAVAVDEAGNAYVADATDHALRKVTPQGRSVVLAGQPGSFGFVDGAAGMARFRTPAGIAVGRDGVVYMADTGNHAIRRIAADGTVSTLAGTGQPGNRDGSGTQAQFNEPYGVAVGSDGVLAVADFANHSLRRVTPAGVVTTLAGSSGNGGFVDGSGSAARLNSPIDVALDAAGTAYVVDRNNHAIRKVTSGGVVSTLAGSGTRGFANGSGRAASFHFPSGIAVDRSGNVLVADTDNQVLRHITPAGEVSTLAGATLGAANGVGSAARFDNPKDVAVDADGRIVVADRGNRRLRTGQALASGQVAIDCLLDWGEVRYASLLTPPAPTQTWAPYTYRYYSSSQVYVGVSASDAQVYLMTNGKLDALGSLAGYLSLAGCVAP